MTRPATRAPEEGFTLVEVLVSLAIAGILLGSITTFVVGAMSSTRQQGRRQTAVQLALDGMETARTLRGTALLEGRAPCTSTCPGAATGAAAQLADTQRWDVASSPATTPNLRLPASPDIETVDGVAFSRYWYVGRCWAPTGGGACADTSTHAPTPARPVPFHRVVIAVTWTGKGCGTSSCSYVASALFAANALDPTFRS